jgi:glutamyl-tRNA synthetase
MSEVGRYAPSPTGTLHLGNLRTALAAWAATRARQGRFLLRIEDLDGPRCRPEFEARQLDDLRLLGIDWDETPIRQSERSQIYQARLMELKKYRLAYPCFCSRRDIAEVLSAPHGPGGSAYPGTCAELDPWIAADRIDRGDQHCWRLRVGSAPSSFFDAFAGPYQAQLAATSGDFVIRRADGLFAYQLACAVDDAESGVTEVVRGADLLDSGARQAHLLQSLGLPVPRYRHIPLMLGPDGRRLAKRIGSEDLTGLLQRGFDVTAIRSYLAWTLGLCAPGDRLTMSEVVARWDWARIPRSDVHHDESVLATFRPTH